MLIQATKLFTLDTLCPLTLNATVYTNIIALRIRESQVIGGVKGQNFITLSMPINTLESIPEDYKIDYSNDTKIIFNDNDDMDVIGDDVDELQEDEFIQAKLPKYPQRKKSSNNNDFFSLWIFG